MVAMATSEGLSFSVVSVVECVLQQHGNRLRRGLDLESRRAEEAASRRYEAANWLRKMVGVVAAKDLRAEPSEEEFRLGLRSGLILCNVLNSVQPGAVPKVVERPNESALILDGAALSAYQYFENVRNFLVAAEEIGLPTFEASDLEQGGISARVVNSVLALKSYHDWKQTGSNGAWKFGGNVKPTTSVKQFVRKNLEPFSSSLSRNGSIKEKNLTNLFHDACSHKTSSSQSLSTLVHALLLDKKPEELPQLVESVLSKVVEEFEERVATQNELVNQQTQAAPRDFAASQGKKSSTKFSHDNTKVDERQSHTSTEKQENFHRNDISDEESKRHMMKQQIIFDRQGRDLQELKHTLCTTKAGLQIMQRKFQEELHNLGMHIHGLAHAASGYHSVLEENRRLYNEVQDLKGSIRVYCRIRPFLNGQPSHMSTVEHIEDGNITIKTPAKYGKCHKSFCFNKIFGPTATQVEVFADMQPLIRSVLEGYNVCIFAYGQTGSGKTYTMTGPRDITEHSQGVNYRSLSDLFFLVEQRRNTFCYDVSVQMIEIYNEQVRDLLVSDGLNKRLEIRNSSQNGLNVPDASLVPVTSTSDVINLMNLGQRNRAVGATALNDRSSRSHSCLTVHVQGRDLTSGTILRGCMHLVDLAGSERADKSEATGDRLKEAQHINKSLSALGDVIASLAQKNSHVPYRNSKLTKLLQDSLGGQAKTLMFVHISPEPEAIGETISTLKFAERVSTVELGAARVNKGSADVKELKEQIASLKAALARKEGESISPGGHRSKSGGPSPLHSKKHGGDISVISSKHTQPMGDVGNIEACTELALRKKGQSFDLDKALRNSPLWPTSGQNFGVDDKEMDSGEWVDKVMVKKQEAVPRIDNPLGCWEADNDHMLEIDAATTDSSEPDLLWQFNHSKLPTIPNGIGLKAKKLGADETKSPELRRSMIPKIGPSLSRKLANSAGTPVHKKGRQQPVSAEDKRKGGIRK